LVFENYGGIFTDGAGVISSTQDSKPRCCATLCGNYAQHGE